MDLLEIRGGKALSGQVTASGAKNAALPILCATMLAEKPVTLANIPDVADVVAMRTLLTQLGCKAVMRDAHTVTISPQGLSRSKAPYDLMRKMRASILVMGPLLAKLGQAQISLPGGCAIGVRPVDLHIQAMRDLGASITLEDGYLMARAPKGGLAGGRIKLAFPSVGATENALMAATLARGESIIEQAACEPEIEDLARFLQAIGAKIEGAGTSQITVQGHHNLGGAHHRVIADRIEVGSLLIAAAATGGQIRVSSCNPDHLDCVLAELQKANCTIHSTDDEITLKAGDRFEAQTIETQPFPGYPTDLQAQFMALMTQANGTSVIHETLFENRFMHVPELVRLGANITIKDRKAMVEGPTSLKGAPVMATDLRASMSLVIAGLVASGVTQIRRIYHLDRGYERLHTKLVALGADITRKPDQEGGL